MDSAYRIELQAGDVLFREGDAPTTAFLIEEGTLRISTRQHDATLVLGDLGAGVLIGETAVLDKARRNATATALSHCVLTPIDRSQFAERLESADPLVRALVLSQLGRYRNALARFRGAPASIIGSDAAAHADAPLAHDKIRLESQLRQALESHELDLHLQPILHIASGRIAGFEALTRWHHSERGPVLPAEFIALAEETSLIVPVGEYVLDEVCSALQQFSPLAAKPFVALNVSGRQLQDTDFVERMVAQVRAHGIAPTQLKLEITETVALDFAQVTMLIARCHREGIAVALDDFGAGYSNLGLLHKLPFDALKLDKEFIHQLDDPRCLAIVRAVIGMARSLDCAIVAEGVETAAQLAQLTALDCHYAQGYFIGRPQTVAEALATFAADRAA
ncbi:MAG: EAL domain-containing protein [Rudaea sp.]